MEKSLEEKLSISNSASHSKNSTVARGLIPQSWLHLPSGQSPGISVIFYNILLVHTDGDSHIKGYLE